MGFRAHFLVILALIFMATDVRSDIAKDKAQCADQLVALATCLSYVGSDNTAKAPTPDCCSGLKKLLEKSKFCLCLLIKDKDDPTLGLKINTARAFNLPTACHAPANISECPVLLHLTPNSPEAKIFTQAANTTSAPVSPVPSTPTTSPATSSPSSVSSVKSNGGSSGKIANLMSMKIASVAFAWCLTAHHILLSNI